MYIHWKFKKISQMCDIDICESIWTCIKFPFIYILVLLAVTYFLYLCLTSLIANSPPFSPLSTWQYIDCHPPSLSLWSFLSFFTVSWPARLPTGPLSACLSQPPSISLCTYLFHCSRPPAPPLSAGCPVTSPARCGLSSTGWTRPRCRMRLPRRLSAGTGSHTSGPCNCNVRKSNLLGDSLTGRTGGEAGWLG